MTAGNLSIHHTRVEAGAGGALESILDACVRINDGIIQSVTAMADCGCLDDDTVIDAMGKVSLPGFIDGHRHTWQTALRHTMVGRSFHEYGASILGLIGPHVTPGDVYAGTLLGALSALDAGITTVVDWAHATNSPEHADASLEALTDAGIRAQFAYGIPRDGSGRWIGPDAPEHPRDLERVHLKLAGNQLITAAMAARGPEMSSETITGADIAFARDLGVRISMHVGAADMGHTHSAVTRVQLLLDEREISRLLVALAHSVDRKDFEALAGLYATTGELVTPWGGHSGRAGLAEYVRKDLGHFHALHHVSAGHEIHVEPGAGIASARATLLSTHVLDEGGVAFTTVGGYYEINLVREEGAWRFNRVVINPSWRFDSRLAPGDDPSKGKWIS